MKKLVTFETFLYAPPVEWSKLYESNMQGGPHDVERDASFRAISAVRIVAYITHRLNGGDHAGAVKAQNKTVRKVRKALGYAYPNAADITF